MNMAVTPVDSRKLIDVQLLAETEGVNRCPYESWYMFKRCTINTCKNYTVNTARRCLALDRQAATGSKAISDAELHLFKFHDANVSTRFVSMRRKKAVEAVRCVVALHTYVTHIRDSASRSEHTRKFVSKTLAKAAKSKPLSIKRVGFEPWMWGLLTDETYYQQFAGRRSEFQLHQLLRISEETLESVRAEIESCES